MSPAENDDQRSPGPAGKPAPAKVGGEGIGSAFAPAGSQADDEAIGQAAGETAARACCLAAAPVDDQGQGARIYGKQGCPHTQRARAALPRARFVDVLADPAALAEMLRLSGGARRVPVIVRSGEHGDVVQIGFKRGA